MESSKVKLRARPRGVNESDEVDAEISPVEASVMELESADNFLPSSVTLVDCLVSTTEIRLEIKNVDFRILEQYNGLYYRLICP